jgi:protein involved in polysaccharide export with SLBB domain
MELEARDGVLAAIARAGGLTEFAKKSRIFVLRKEPEPMRVRFDYGELARGEGPASFRLQEGDVIVVE